jgi:hypothetical protein
LAKPPNFPASESRSNRVIGITLDPYGPVGKNLDQQRAGIRAIKGTCGDYFHGGVNPAWGGRSNHSSLIF